MTVSPHQNQYLNSNPDYSPLEQWQLDRQKFYNLESIKSFIKDYFEIEKGTRCTTYHQKDMYALGQDPIYRMWNNQRCIAMTLRDNISLEYQLSKYWTVHSFMYAFSESITTNWFLETERNNMFKNNIVGLNPVIELDSPDDPKSTTAKRLTFFDQEIIDQFDNAINIIDKVLTEYDTEYNLMFSGNGIYVLLEGYYGDDLLEEGYFRDNFANLLDHLKDKDEYNLGDKSKVHVDNNKAPWNDYFKIPFTFHETRPRISIPIPKGELDKNWIDFHSDIENIRIGAINYHYLHSIIHECDWEKIW